MSNALRTQLAELATSLVESILATARSVPLEELWADPPHARREPHPNGVEARSALPAIAFAGGAPLRSGHDNAKTLELVVLLLRGQKGGLRAEHLRNKLGVLKPEMTRVLKQGRATKKITRRGQRRATTYFAATA